MTETPSQDCTDLIRHEVLTSEDLRANLSARFLRSAYCELRRIDCTIHDNVLILEGTVSSYYLWQVAQSLALDLGIEAIDNRLVVRPPAGFREISDA